MRTTVKRSTMAEVGCTRWRACYVMSALAHAGITHPSSTAIYKLLNPLIPDIVAVDGNQFAAGGRARTRHYSAVAFFSVLRRGPKLVIFLQRARGRCPPGRAGPRRALRARRTGQLVDATVEGASFELRGVCASRTQPAASSFFLPEQVEEPSRVYDRAPPSSPSWEKLATTGVGWSRRF
jgi:hypothetical protein